MLKIFNPLWLINHYFTCYWSGAASIVGSVISGAMGSKASKSATDAQSQASALATEEQRRQYDLNREDLAPYRKVGTGALNKLANLLGISTDTSSAQSNYDAALAEYNKALNSNNQVTQTQSQSQIPMVVGANMGSLNNNQSYVSSSSSNNNAIELAKQKLDAASQALQQSGQQVPSSDDGSLLSKFSQNDLNNDVVYQNGLKFGLDQGTGAIDARARASGSSDSGAVLKALTKYANDYGTTKANDAYNRDAKYKSSVYNMLSGTAGTGQIAVNAGVQSGMNSANNISNNLLQSGNARAAGIVGRANAWGNTIGTITNAASDYITQKGW